MLFLVVISGMHKGKRRDWKDRVCWFGKLLPYIIANSPIISTTSFQPPTTTTNPTASCLMPSSKTCSSIKKDWKTVCKICYGLVRSCKLPKRLLIMDNKLQLAKLQSRTHSRSDLCLDHLWSCYRPTLLQSEAQYGFLKDLIMVVFAFCGPILSIDYYLWTQIATEETRHVTIYPRHQ